MAARFLASHGIDLNSVLSTYLSPSSMKSIALRTTSISQITNARLPAKPSDTTWDISISGGFVSSLEPHAPSTLNIAHLPGVLDAKGGLCAPSFCHAHVHLDKCFLLGDPKYSDLEIVKGDFAEAMSITGEAKARFDEEDLLRRGRRLIDESSEAGVTAMRAFVEVDEVVGLKCVQAAVKLKEEYTEVCEIQVCAFAQLSLFDDQQGKKRRGLLAEALKFVGVDVVGSTPYVEDDKEKMKENVKWTIEKALKSGKHIDFHLDYNIDPATPALIWFVLEELKRQGWPAKAKTSQKICMGHCTRLTLFTVDEWRMLRQEIGELPITFVGLPTSDLFMMGRPQDLKDGGGQRPRATLQIPQLTKDYGIDGAISINNIGNAFTPWGTCDPLSLASMAVGVYQTGTKQDTELLYDLVSTRAFNAIGCGHISAPSKSCADEGNHQHGASEGLTGSAADFVIFSDPEARPNRRPLSISEAVYAGGPNFARRTIFRGKLVNHNY